MGSPFIKTGLSPLYDIEMLIKFCVFLEFCVFLKQVFPINKYITFQSYNLIYLMECRTCKQSYVGYTTSNLPKKFSNYNSHIEKGIRSCKLVNHFLDIDHDLDFSTTASYNSSLRRTFLLS